ncbi:MAG: uroporphyrinogen-III C-methyltransferase [Rhodospirillaceae bacterium]|jgi:uroporphyrin-III C-methyltransferase/precorrin-2 dehydrogenase/sirohydrochlorin ferrochelatase|nr:uroporphyrinogen-III C-methyltransferase [Rhodospirillaceae bacterium]MBT5458844.1 uroporphyrinogen-III C-methyltransferase [Rhodospirillaceae bacterium]
MRYLPIFKNIQDRPCLVVGGGPVAQRKIHMLLRAQATVTVIAPLATDDLHQWHRDGRMAFQARAFREQDIDGYALVFSATGIKAVDQAVSEAAKKAGIPVNVVDAPALSDFIMPAIVDRSPVVVAVSTAGAAPVLARQIRAAIEALLPADLGRLAKSAETLRDTIRDRFISPTAKRLFWDDFFKGWRSGASVHHDESTITELPPNAGRVSIVGAGPGDPDLLTLKALQNLQNADVIIYDRLVGPEILDYARRDAETIYAGKAPGQHSHSQMEINALLAHHAGAGKHVVRLKGGDPFIFGRGGEERRYLIERGIQVDIVPGITAAAGCAAEAGIPLTHRGTAQSVTYLTGTSNGDIPDYDWQALAKLAGTLVFYMGVSTAADIAARFTENGLAPETPVAVIENGTRATQRTITGTIGTLGALIRDNRIQNPALLVIGDVVAEANAASDVGTALAIAS